MARQPSKRLSLALSILAELPTTIRALSADGGVVPVHVISSDAAGIRAHVPTDRGRPGAELKVRIRDEEGCGHDIVMDVREAFFAAENLVQARLVVRAVKRFEGDRSAPRARVEDLALVRIEYGELIATGVEFDARLADLSSDGVSFITTEDVRVGDRLGVMATIDGSLVRLTALVLHTTPAHYGRQRVGAEILEAADADRRRLAALARTAPVEGSREQRFEPRAA